MNESQYRSNFIDYLYRCKKEYYKILKSLQIFCECYYANDITFTRQQAKLIMKYISKLHKIIDKLEDDKEKYFTTIDKAIEYIEKQEDYFNEYPLINRQELLDILKGKEDEEN